MKSNYSKNEADTKSNLPLHLPDDYPWKVLYALHLDLSQYLSAEDNTLLSLIVRERDFDSLEILSEDWGLQSIAFKDAPLMQIRAKYQLTSLIKKFQFDFDRQKRKDTAIQKFFAAEMRCKEFNEGGYKALLRPGDSDWHLKFFAGVKRHLVRILGEELPSFRKFVPWSRHGPGANLDTVDGKVSSYDKYTNWPYSCTLGAYRYARFLIETDQRWYGALQNSYRERKCIPMHYPLDMQRFWADVVHIVDGDRITTVPKNARTDRSIAIPPALNIMLQLGVDGYIRRRLLRFGINLNSQRLNQVLARKGSIDGSLFTLDLSAASDTMSLKLCELVLPKAWYDYLIALRSEYGYVGGELMKHRYEKISAMGNGYTFVLESALFASITLAAAEAAGRKLSLGEYAIYGDDIIAPVGIYNEVVRGLHLCGFAINVDKTFFQGYVRESCGSDWYKGRPVRPVFLKKAPSDATALFNDHNQLKRITSMYWGFEESNVEKRLYRWVPVFCRQFVGPLSDTMFDGYLHQNFPSKCFKKDEMVFRFPRLYQKTLSVSAQDFHMRKLMHTLRGIDVQPGFKHGGAFVEGAPSAGSRFRPKRKASVVGITYSVASNWCNSYDELAYVKLR